MLRFKQLFNERRERLVHQDDPRARRVFPSICGEHFRGFMNFNAVGHQLLYKRGGFWHVALITRNEVRIRRFATESFDVVTRCLITVEEQFLSILRSHIQNRHRRAFHIVHSVTKPPPSALPGTAVKDAGEQVALVCWKFVDRVEAWCRIPVKRCFCKERNTVTEDVSEIEESRIPIIVAHPMDCTRHAVRIEIRCYVGAYEVEPSCHQWVNVGRDRLHKWWNKDARGERGCLMLTVKDDGIPLQFGPRDRL